ncbi:MAG TPA: bifunctional UDP-3-O-[3-hydroxymyristoyl] N-acetylglucosamine deacetylase/3-hydroxyacyl-ACP dehydratase [Longimicrobiaceae bacterium]|nr:bifunctional UDP-3-O-[3-hydroxymyristoyl] N-acetylglucosamine deacetylase/3-hydroxyacyl-ACP dehydratase [Longimicrobiaceae bacterium]
MTAPRQQTIATPQEMEGVGLHTGATVKLRVLPAAVDAGVLFRRTDLPGAPEIAALAGNVTTTDMGTTLAQGDARVHTVEHVLSAIAGAGIDNVIVEIDAAEPPAGDGSALPFLKLLGRADRVEQDAPVRAVVPDEGFFVRDGDSEYVVAPADDLELSVTIEFDHPLIGRQHTSLRVEPEGFAEEIAPARTFGFTRWLDDLRARGLARGGTPENAVVLTDDGLLEGQALRFPDEFARHKALDLLGDLALIGARLRAHVVARRPSHRGNVALAKEILARAEKKTLARPILSIEQIMQYLPHRYPFLLVDRVVEYDEGTRIVGLKNVTINEPFFVGHFPGRPTMPGVLIIEAMAQVGGLLLMDTIDNPEDKIVYFMTLDNVKWRRPVIPGDQIRFEVEVIQVRGRTARMRGVGTVDGQVVAEAEMMARVVDR